VLDELAVKSNVTIEIDKRLPVQGGLGAASSNAVATMVALERALKKSCLRSLGLELPLRLDLICLCFWWAGR